MEIERIDPERAIPYVPHFEGERTKAGADPVYAALTFHLRPMTVAQFEGAAELVRPEERGGEVVFRIRTDAEARALAAHVARIENLRFAGGEAITDGAAFAAARDRAPGRLAPLYMEILAAIRDISVLREGERKN